MQEIIDIETESDLYASFDIRKGLMVDIRGLDDRRSGYMEGSIHVDLMSQNFVEYFSDISPNKPLLLYCTDGSRSRVAIRILSEMGFKHLFHLSKGILKWDGILLS